MAVRKKTKHIQETALLNVENTSFSQNMLHLYEVVPRMSKTFQPYVNKLWLKDTQDTIDTLKIWKYVATSTIHHQQ